jgi:E3 ubiquitin-protein ligase RBX1
MNVRACFVTCSFITVRCAESQSKTKVFEISRFQAKMQDKVEVNGLRENDAAEAAVDDDDDNNTDKSAVDLKEKQPIDEQAENEQKDGQDQAAERYVVKKWSAVAMWAWDIVVDNCAICRNHIMDCCIECQAREADTNSEECTVAWGVCNHAFHFHCISRWLTNRQVCPLDNKRWEFNRWGSSSEHQ